MHQQSTLPFDDDAPLCPRCGTIKTASITKSGRYAGKWSYRCASCKRAVMRARYVANPEPQRAAMRANYAANTDSKRTAARAHYAANPEPTKTRARIWAIKNAERIRIAQIAGLAVRKAIRRGILTRPNTCEECGTKGGAIQAAHRDYSRPLDVRWLCRSCHSIWDHQKPKTLAHAPASAL